MSETSWMIEKPEPGGVYWWGGDAVLNEEIAESMRLDVVLHNRETYPSYFTPDANKAIRFRSEADARSVMRLFPASWPRIFVVTEHAWVTADGAA